MAYTLKDWKRRIAERSDMTSGLVHLTRGNNGTDVRDILFDIISTKRIIGSTTSSGFICGEYPAVCFQDTPLPSICQNVFFEQKKCENDKSRKIRYMPFGFYFEKPYVFKKGGRPVIYDKTEDAKNFLGEDQWWRIVNMDLSDEKNVIDWSHEREWRIKGDFEFDLSELTLVVIELSNLKKVLGKYKNQFGVDLRDEIKGIMTLSNLLF